MSKLHEYANRVEGHRLDPDNPKLPPVLARALRHLGDLEEKLFATFPQLAQKRSDTPLTPTGLTIASTTPASIAQAVNPAPPPPLKFKLTQAGGLSHIVITLPQNIQPQSSKTMGLIAGDDPNSSLAPIYHRLRSSSTGSFDVASNVNVYGPSTQVVWSLPDTNAFWQIQSSFDGKTFGEWTNI